MGRDLLATFDELKPTTAAEPDEAADLYPGSKKKKQSVTKRQPKGGWDDVPKMVLTVKGEDINFYTVGVLAELLDRKAQTIRKWENLGYIPLSKFRSPGRTVHGQKRIYTREMIEGIVRIAREEQIVGAGATKNVSNTQFPQRVAALFKEMGVLG